MRVNGKNTANLAVFKKLKLALLLYKIFNGYSDCPSQHSHLYAIAYYGRYHYQSVLLLLTSNHYLSASSQLIVDMYGTVKLINATLLHDCFGTNS